MKATIEIDDDVLKLLKRHAEPFVDTPNDVLRRLLLDPAAYISANQAASKKLTAATIRPAARTRSKLQKTTTRKKPVKRRRAPSSALLSEKAYELPLLDVLDAADFLERFAQRIRTGGAIHVLHGHLNAQEFGARRRQSHHQQQELHGATRVK